jgi:chromosome segregation protein
MSMPSASMTSWPRTSPPIVHSRNLRMALAEGEPKLEALQQLQDDTAEAQRDTETKLADWQQRWDSHTRHAGEVQPRSRSGTHQARLSGPAGIDLSKRREALEAEQKATDVAALDVAGEQLHAEHDTQRERVETLGSLLDQHKLSHEKVLDEERQVQSASMKHGSSCSRPAVARLARSAAARGAGSGRKRRQWLAGSLGIDKSRRLGEALQVDAGWETAVETVLSGLLDSVLVDGPHDLAREFGSLDNADVALA